ncbi:MAG TPA: hypothetical protein VHC95_07060 [Opitutales bacterium]|nr:hypothetical protein [Opitutales bacterium]
MKIDNKFELRQRVYSPLDPDARGIVIAITVNGAGGVLYTVAWEDKSERQHYDFELTAERVFGEKGEED